MERNGHILLGAAIKAAGHSLRDAAKLVAMDAGHLSRVLAGTSGVGISAACRCRDVFGIPVDSWRDDLPSEDSGSLPVTTESAEDPAAE